MRITCTIVCLGCSLQQCDFYISNSHHVRTHYKDTDVLEDIHIDTLIELGLNIDQKGKVFYYLRLTHYYLLFTPHLANGSEKSQN